MTVAAHKPDWRGDGAVRAETEVLLVRIRHAILQVKQFEADLELVGVSLKCKMISPAGAKSLLKEIGADHWLPNDPADRLEVLPDGKAR